MIDDRSVLGYAAVLGCAAVLALLGFGVYATLPRAPKTAGGKTRRRAGGSLSAALLDAATTLLPDSSTVLSPGDAALDPIYGGRHADAFGGPSWGYYSAFANPGVKGGMTCGIVAAYLASKAGWPADMINRATDDADAPGGGYTLGQHIAKLVQGAQSRGWYVGYAPGFQLQPGDLYHVMRQGKGEHVGVVVSVDDNQIETADGGQGTGADVKRTIRTLMADNKTLMVDGVPATILGAIRPSGAGSMSVSSDESS